jgi:CDP-diacylglycerol--glycerol-3-phosphate 3-phosphatidyltransferase
MLTLSNRLTLFRIVLTPVFVFLLFSSGSFARIALVFVLCIASLTDWYDGYLARRFGYVTKWGQFLDPLADKIFITAGFLSFSVLGYVRLWMVLVILVRDFLITGFRFYGMIRGKPVATNLFAKIKTSLQFLVLCLILIFHLVAYPKTIDTAVLLWNRISVFNFFHLLMWLVVLFTVVSGTINLIENRIRLKEMLNELYRIFIPSNI